MTTRLRDVDKAATDAGEWLMPPGADHPSTDRTVVLRLTPGLPADLWRYDGRRQIIQSQISCIRIPPFWEAIPSHTWENGEQVWFVQEADQ